MQKREADLKRARSKENQAATQQRRKKLLQKTKLGIDREEGVDLYLLYFLLITEPAL